MLKGVGASPGMGLFIRIAAFSSSAEPERQVLSCLGDEVVPILDDMDDAHVSPHEQPFLSLGIVGLREIVSLTEALFRICEIGAVLQGKRDGTAIQVNQGPGVIHAAVQKRFFLQVFFFERDEWDTQEERVFGCQQRIYRMV